MSLAASKLFCPQFFYVSLHALNMSNEIEAPEVHETKIYLHEVPLQPESQKRKQTCVSARPGCPYTFVPILIIILRLLKSTCYFAERKRIPIVHRRGLIRFQAFAVETRGIGAVQVRQRVAAANMLNGGM